MEYDELKIDCPEKPEKWPANDRELLLDNVCNLVKEFKKNPGYITKERLLTFICDYDLNQRSQLGLYRVTDYEVACINTLYFDASMCNINALKVFLYEIVGEVTRLQKNMSYISEALEKKEPISITPYEEGLLLPLKLYHFAYQRFTVEKDKDFADKLTDVVNEIAENAKENAYEKLVHAYVSLLNDLSYMHGNKREEIWKFTRDELKSLFSLESLLLASTNQNPIERPLKGVLMTQISNFILKSRHQYNEDYICKYVSKDVASLGYSNHEIWMNKTENLNDEREQKVVPELFKNTAWIDFEWAKNTDFTAVRTYYVSSFSKSYTNNEMKNSYGSCIYGFKDDRLIELLAPIYMAKYTGDELPYLSQVIAFDVLYDQEEAREELKFLMNVIDNLPMTSDNKKCFFQEILQYWILSVKDSKWEHEKERRYVLFLYKEYKYLEMIIDDGYLKLETSLFMLPDFVLGENPVMSKLLRSVNNKRQASAMKDYLFCYDCLSRDFDAVHNINNTIECPLCASKNVKKIYVNQGI